MIHNTGFSLNKHATPSSTRNIHFFLRKINKVLPQNWDRTFNLRYHPNSHASMRTRRVQTYTWRNNGRLPSPLPLTVRFALGSPFTFAAIAAIPPPAALYKRGHGSYSSPSSVFLVWFNYSTVLKCCQEVFKI